MPANQLRIKGFKNGIVIEFEEGDTQQAITLLEEKLNKNPGFFYGTEAVLVFPEKIEIDEEILLKVYKVLESKQIRLRELRRIGKNSAATLANETQELKTTTEPNNPKNLLWLEKRLRSGDKITADGDLVLIGDVNPGAEVSAKGNILVWGSLLGIAHAGRDGDEKARIMALRLKATQLRIGRHISRAPDESLEPQGPEVARVGKDGIVIETWEKAVKDAPLPFWRRLLYGREVKL